MPSDFSSNSASFFLYFDQSSLSRFHCKNASTGTPPDPKTTECLGLNRLTSSGNPEFIDQRPLLISMTMRYD